jgi:lysophospholipase L1-like esterase
MKVLRLSSLNYLHAVCHSPILRIALLATTVFGAPACGKLGLGGNSPTAPSGPPAAGSNIVYTAMGASDATGHGSSAECLPFENGCNGNGYVQVVTRALRAQGFAVTLNNLGLPTAVIGPDFQALGRQLGRTIVGNFIDQEMPFVLPATTLVTIFAGGNEVNTITGALGAGVGGSDPLGYIDNQVRAFGIDYSTLMSGISSRASTRIVLLNVPNLAGLPYLAGASLAQRQAAQRASVGMTTTVVNRLASESVSIVDLMCDARTYLASNYFSDGFHPNDSGYAYIASEVLRAVTSASYPSPQGSCGAMTIVPAP